MLYIYMWLERCNFFKYKSLAFSLSLSLSLSLSRCLSCFFEISKSRELSRIFPGPRVIDEVRDSGSPQTESSLSFFLSFSLSLSLSLSLFSPFPFTPCFLQIFQIPS